MEYKSEDLEISVQTVNDKYDPRKIMISFINYRDGAIFVQKLWNHEAQFIIDALQKALLESKEV